LGFTISERPIFLCNLQQVDEYILPPQTKALVQTVCDRLKGNGSSVKRALSASNAHPSQLGGHADTPNGGD
jgi:hypothetical protein